MPSGLQIIPYPDSCLVFVQVIKKMDLATSIDHHLVASAYSEAGIVTRTKIHQTFTRCRIGLLVDGTRNRETAADTLLQS